MKARLIFSCSLFLFFTIMMPVHVFAHGAQLIAFVQQGKVQILCAFTGGHPAAHVTVKAFEEKTGRELGTVKTNAKGEAALPIPVGFAATKQDMRLTFRTADGHGASTTILAKEFVAAVPASDGNGAAMPAGSGLNQRVLYQTLEMALDEHLQEYLEPVHGKLAVLEQKRKTDMRDIVGGIGYIFGLFGLFAWMKSTKKRE